jgi:hypothetical protein
MKRAIALFGLLTLGSSSAFAEWSANLQYERFKWTEPSVGVTEKGPRVGLGAGWTQNKASGWGFAYRGALYVGSVNYDGATLVGNQPIQSTTDYAGILNEIQAIYRSSGGGAQLVAGLALDYWNRQLTKDQHEEYWVYFLRLGGEFGGRMTQGWFVGGGVKYPLYVVEDPHARDIGFDQDTTLHPGRAFSLYADIGYRFGRHWSLNGYYDSYRFKESQRSGALTGPTCTAAGFTSCVLFQPASNADSYGLRLHYHF